MMNRYEMIYIIDTGLEEAARKELIERVSGWITGNGGEIEKIDETWGKRRLAYAINYITEGYYVLISFTSAPEFPKELDRILGITDGIIRSMIVCKDE